jgi:hypothetical protein
MEGLVVSEANITTTANMRTTEKVINQKIVFFIVFSLGR